MGKIITPEQLFKTSFEGIFYRDPKWVDEAIETHQNINKRIESGELEGVPKLTENQVRSLPMNDKQSWSVKVLSYDENKRTFIARGEDYWGESVMGGNINDDNTLRFRKLLIDSCPEGVDSGDRYSMRDLFFKGEVRREDNYLVLEGKYTHEIGGTITGFWNLKSEPIFASSII